MAAPVPPLWVHHIEWWPLYDARLLHSEDELVQADEGVLDLDVEQTDDPRLAAFLGLPPGQPRIILAPLATSPPLVLSSQAARELALALLRRVYVVEGSTGHGQTRDAEPDSEPSG